MIESARFTNINDAFVDFNTDDIPFTSFTTEVEWRFTEKNRAQEHGIYAGESYLGRRIFHCEGDLFADSSAQYIQRRFDMINALMPRPQYGQKFVGTLDLLFSGMSETLSSECTLDGYPELPLDASSPARSKYQVNFKSYDPRLYGAWQSVDVAYNPAWENIGGRVYDKTYDKFYVGTGPVQSNLISNSGNFDTYPILRFYGPVTDPAAILSTGDGRLLTFALIGLTLNDVNDYVTVDFQRHTVVRASGENLYSYASNADWWRLEPGALFNSVTFSGYLLGAPAHMSIQWRNAYMF